MENQKVHKTSTIEKVEITRKKLFGKKVELKTYEMNYILSTNDLQTMYQYSIKGVTDDDPDIWIIQHRNIKEILYNSEDNTYVIFFDWDYSDYVNTIGKWLDSTEIIKEDLVNDCCTIENIFNIDIEKEFTCLGFHIIKDEALVKDKITKYELELANKFPEITKLEKKQTSKTISKEIISQS